MLKAFGHQLWSNLMTRSSRGQMVVIVALIIPVLLGAISLGTDVAVFYFNWMQLQKAADAAALAGANYLPDNPSTAQSTAIAYAESNGIKAAEIIATSVASNDLSISVTLQRTVPYFFARTLGLSTGQISTSATASPQYAPSTVNASTSGQVPSGGDSNGANGTNCSTIGACDLIPIGLDSNTTYTDGQQITLQQGEIGPGNWDLLALGGTGGANLRTNIANGFNSMLSVGDWVTTEPGKKVGPVDQGFQDRLDTAASVDPNGTYASHTLNDPRVMILPVVDWEGQHGRSSVEVMAFASVWLDSYSSGQVTVNFINQVIANSYGNANSTAPFFGTRGTPFLTR
jgi:Flp pilus assembly protein TadG